MSNSFIDLMCSAIDLSVELNAIKEEKDEILYKRISELQDRMYRIQAVLTDLIVNYWSIYRRPYFRVDFELPYYWPYCENQKNTTPNDEENDKI